MTAHTTNAARDVIAERERQICKEGWTREHDDDRESDGAMAIAAACYAAWLELPTADSAGGAPSLWPWDRRWWKPTDRRRDLVKAGALILAEIERIDRAAAKGQEK